MRFDLHKSLFITLAVGALLLSACRGASPTATITPSATITLPGLTLEAPETELPYPGPVDENPPTSTPESYPAPGGIGQTATPVADASAYPAPESGGAATPTVTQILVETPTPDAYPGPGTAIAQVPATPSQTSVGAYPGPVETSTNVGPYPGPAGTATSTPPGAPTGQATQTPVLTPSTPQATVTTPGALTATPSVTPTPALVRTRLIASDPASFQPASGGIQLVEFFAFWSPMSKSMAPVMNGLEERYKGRITFVYLDIDDPANGLYKWLLGDRLPPVFFLLDGGGNVLNQWQGYVPAQEFENAFNAPVP